MNKERIGLLIVDDDENMGQSIKDYFLSLNHPHVYFEAYFIAHGKESFEFFKKNDIDIAVLDVRLKDMSGMELLKKMKEEKPQTDIILLTGYGSGEATLQALKLGAYDFLSKPFDLEALEKILVRAYEKKILINENRTIHNKISLENSDLSSQDMAFIGQNSRIKEIISLINDISSTDCNVLIQGDSGTGKELIARLIHKNSLRNNELFFPINCGAIPENLLESELFGYEKGAFTGAANRKLGLFEIANSGTLFLDEIGDLPLNFQVKLLRILEEGEFNRIGGTKIIKTNARVLSASNKNLKEEVEKGFFRRDLYYRLNVITLYLPSLKERKEDIPLLVDYFIKKQCQKIGKSAPSVSKEAMELLMTYEWPGNVRELQNLIDRIIILTPGLVITPEAIARNLSLLSFSDNQEDMDDDSFVPLVKKNEFITLEKLEELYMRYVLDQVNYSKNKAALILNISERTLYRKIKEFNIQEAQKKSVD